MNSEDKTKIAILGGGMAGLTAAFELTATQELRDKHEITIYQMGWRLGGKCATGRGVFDRIEEHGIHAFVGSYYNSLGLMSSCYDELSRLLEKGDINGGVLPSFVDALRPADTVVLWEWIDRQMIDWPFLMKSNKLKIATHADFERSLGALKKIMAGAVALGRLYYSDCVRKESGGSGPAQCKEDYEHIQREKGRKRRRVRNALVRLYRLATFSFSLFAWALKRRRELRAYLASTRNAGLLTAFAHTFLSWFSGNKKNIPISARLRRVRIQSNYILTICRGIFSPHYNLFADGFDILDDLNYIDWLRYHGLSKESEAAPIPINNVDISYNFPDGDNSQQPLMAAGTYLRWTLRSMLNLQAFVWWFEAGTGETVIAPLYHVLKKRGVKFAFFHKVKALRLADGGEDIGAIEFDVQATLGDGVDEYDPLVRIDYKPSDAGGYLLCWPNRPKYNLLKGGDKLEALGYDFESYWSKPIDGARPLTLHAGVHYDKIVFAISIGAVPHLFPDLDIMGDANSAKPGEPSQTAKWRAMVAGVPACATQTLQVWLNTTSGRMGAAGLNQAAHSRYGVISGAFVAPFNGEADFTRLIQYEGWDRDAWKALVQEKPRSLWYFSGALTLAYPKPGDPPPRSPATPDFEAGETRAEARPFSEAGFPRQQNERVWDFSVQFLQATAGYLLPRAEQPWQPLGLDFSRLQGLDPIVTSGPSPTPEAAARRTSVIERYDLMDAPKGTASLHNQFWKANIEPSERYVQCPPGGTKARLRADDSGFGNLVLAGDWIQNRLNVGSVEGAVMGASSPRGRSAGRLRLTISSAMAFPPRPR